MALQILQADPQGHDAMALLREAAIEARALYSAQHGPHDPWPTNGPTPPKGLYLVANDAGKPVAMGAHRPLDASTTKIRRMFTSAQARRTGAARALLQALEAHAAKPGFAELKPETGNRQGPAIALLASCGFIRIPPFAADVSDPTSACFSTMLAVQP